jgi:hypothetical protein
MMITASCHCGQIRLDVAAAPSEVTDCNCSICRRYGVLWAYYRRSEVSVEMNGTATDTYICNGRTQAFHRCPNCGCVTHWTPFDSTRDDMGVNARLMPSEALENARIRHLDGADTWRYLD